MDGRTVKARLFLSPQRAAEVHRLLQDAGTEDLPRPLQRVGRVLVVEFVEGESLDRVLRKAAPGLERRVARATGVLLGRLHASGGAAGRGPLPGTYRARMKRTIQELARAGLLEPRDAHRLARLEAPATARTGVTHGDLCPENLVRTAPGRLRAIDEEWLSLRPLAFDLARTVSRWPLGPGLEAALLDGYAASGADGLDFVAHRAFWIAAALATSAEHRRRRQADDSAVPVAGLRALARTLEG